jgi:transcriptional regulator with XRE-family HTH domain
MNGTLGERLRACRQGLRLRVHDVAELLRVDKQTVYRWEWSKLEPDLADLCTLADLFATSVGWLVRSEGEGPVYLTELTEEGGPCSSRQAG